MFGAIIGNLPELIGYIASVGLAYMAGKKGWNPLSWAWNSVLGMFRKRS